MCSHRKRHSPFRQRASLHHCQRRSSTFRRRTGCMPLIPLTTHIYPIDKLCRKPADCAVSRLQLSLISRCRRHMQCNRVNPNCWRNTQQNRLYNLMRRREAVRRLLEREERREEERVSSECPLSFSTSANDQDLPASLLLVPAGHGKQELEAATSV